MKPFQAIETVERQFLNTSEAAYYLNRQPQTLRNWAVTNRGPIKCVRLAGRLAWSTDSVRALLANAATELAALNSEVLEKSGQ